MSVFCFQFIKPWYSVAMSATIACGLAICLAAPSRAADPSQADAAAALHKAVDFFRTKIAVQGGYVYTVSDDLSKREGEVKVSPTQVWIQPPATPTVGETYLTLHQLTGDQYYLDAARETAECLIRGQLRSGGWYVSIEFDPEKRRSIDYRVDPPEGKSKRLANRSTLDDNKTQSCIRFLMRLDRVLDFNDVPLHEATLYALDALVQVQYPNGAWPQQFDGPPDPAKFPILKASYPETWSREFPHEPYDHRYTFNDNSIADVVRLMLDAAETYGESLYRASSEKAGDFILLAQLPEPQPGWAQQYNADMHPAWARKFEPPAVTGNESQGVIEILLELYRRTGNEKYLQPVPAALAWLKRSQLPDGNLARFYELHTNRPLYFTMNYELTYSDSDVPTHYRFKLGAEKIAKFEAAYDKLKAEGPPERKPPKPEKVKLTEALASQAAEAATALDPRGAWVEEGRLRNYGSDDSTTHVIATRTFVQNVLTLARFVAAR